MGESWVCSLLFTVIPEVLLKVNEKRVRCESVMRHRFFSLLLDLADDMGLGKTLTMIALILTKKKEAKEEDEETGKKSEGWISKAGN